ncbi:MAG TPA: hypothetical protein VIJ92_08490 [Ginsengibacter sp.]
MADFTGRLPIKIYYFRKSDADYILIGNTVNLKKKTAYYQIKKYENQ